MTATTARLDFFGSTIAMSADAGLATDISKQLLEDFFYFRTTTDATPVIHLHISDTPQKIEGRQIPLFTSTLCKVSALKDGRLCDYGDGVQCLNLFANNEWRVYVGGRNPDLLYEACYTTLLSLSGELLDLAGYHRAHGFAGTLNEKNSFLFLSPSGGGKSAMAALWLERSEARIYSDEIPLLKNRSLYPFPIRMALQKSVMDALEIGPSSPREFRRKIYKTKMLISIPPEKVARPAPLQYILVGEPPIRGQQGQPLIKETSRFSAWRALTENMIVGLGVPQMREHFLRFSSHLPKIFFSRLSTAGQIMKEAQTFVFC